MNALPTPIVAVTEADNTIRFPIERCRPAQCHQPANQSTRPVGNVPLSIVVTSNDVMSTAVAEGTLDSWCLYELSDGRYLIAGRPPLWNRAVPVSDTGWALIGPVSRDAIDFDSECVTLPDGRFWALGAALPDGTASFAADALVFQFHRGRDVA